jgi:hypothetical protein
MVIGDCGSCRQYKLPLLGRDHHCAFIRGIRRIDW